MKTRMTSLVSMLGIGLLGATLAVSAGEMNKDGSMMKKSMSEETMMNKPAMQDDMKKKELRQKDAQDRGLWRSGILGRRPTRASAETRTLKH